jgi:hypothetical protein
MSGMSFVFGWTRFLAAYTLRVRYFVGDHASGAGPSEKKLCMKTCE